MKNIDATSGKILPERKKKRGGRSQNQNQPPTTIDGGEGGIHQKWCHLIHFQGWNSRHDKWMCETNVFHDTPENRVRVGNSSANNKVVKTATAPSSSSKQPKKNEEKKKKKNTKKRGRSKDANDNDNEDEDIDGSMLYQNNLQLIKEACTLPFTLQTKLVDDHDKITKPVYPPPSFNNNNNSNDNQVLNRKGITMLHEIPSSMNIVDVIKEYMNEKKREDVEEFANVQQENDGDDSKKKSENDDGKGNQAVSTSDTKDNIQTIATRAELKLRKKKRKRFAGNLVSLVDLSLPIFLLYKEEQEQFATYISDQGGSADNEDVDGKDQTTDNVDKKRPSAMYGAEHLLRFFIKLPFILSQYDPTTKAEESSYILTSKEESQEFAERISELIIFLQKNLGCFKAKYIAVEC